MEIFRLENCPTLRVRGFLGLYEKKRCICSALEGPLYFWFVGVQSSKTGGDGLEQFESEGEAY